MERSYALYTCAHQHQNGYPTNSQTNFPESNLRIVNNAQIPSNSAFGSSYYVEMYEKLNPNQAPNYLITRLLKKCGEILPCPQHSPLKPSYINELVLFNTMPLLALSQNHRKFSSYVKGPFVHVTARYRLLRLYTYLSQHMYCGNTFM